MSLLTTGGLPEAIWSSVRCEFPQRYESLYRDSAVRCATTGKSTRSVLRLDESDCRLRRWTQLTVSVTSGLARTTGSRCDRQVSDDYLVAATRTRAGCEGFRNDEPPPVFVVLRTSDVEIDGREPELELSDKTQCQPDQLPIASRSTPLRDLFTRNRMSMQRWGAECFWT